MTKIKSIKVNKFRGIEDALIEFGDRVTLICGKNGTSKSTILGMVAQAFNFRKDYTKVPHEDLAKRFYTLSGEPFKSNFSDHFRISEKFDIPGSMDIGLSIYDGAEDSLLDDLSIKLYKYSDRPKPRIIMRGNSTINGASSSRNVTHPVIYISLKRLMPISLRENYIEEKNEYFEENKDEFIRLSQKLLLKNGVSQATATTGTISSAVAHGLDYDKESVSVGEDNVGQIVKALMSFKKLKEEYQDYHGGILLIDEADAGLFPAAQLSFVDVLTKKCKELDLQVVITSHSPTMIEKVYELSKKDAHRYKTIYLTDTFGKIEVKENISWMDIYHDLMVKSVKVDIESCLPKINIYFEDFEAFSFYRAIVRSRKLLKVTRPLKDISLGCDEYKKLISIQVSEFSKKSVIVFDGDVSDVSKYRNVINLPGGLPPDQLLFEFLYNLPEDDVFWKNKIRFTKPVFMNGAAEQVIDTLEITENAGDFDLSEKIFSARQKDLLTEGSARRLFKDFQKHEDIQRILSGTISQNPFVRWCEINREESEFFFNQLLCSLQYCMATGFGADSGAVSAYFKEIKF
ncbi:MAG: AAA family ATPase [Halomonas sp.]|nr:AAA family ATPase [Halomonas sp.]